jgi:hypothetical protein
MLGEPHKSKIFIERLCLIERHDLVILSLLFKDLLDILRDSRVLLQCLHEVVLDVTYDSSYYASDCTSQIAIISPSVRGSKKSYTTGHSLYGLVGRAVSCSIKGLVKMSGSQCVREVAACLLKDDAAETVTEEHYWAVRAALENFSNQPVQSSSMSDLYLSHDF